MPSRQCGCASAQCNCVVRGGDGVEVEGVGSPLDPYVISVSDDLPLTGRLQVVDSSSIDFSLEGSGTTSDPWILSGETTQTLEDLTDVDASNQTPGYVLARNANGTFEMVPAPTAPPGAIATDASIDGDGSAGTPLMVHDYDNIAWLDAADNAPNHQSMTLGSTTDPNPYSYQVERQAPSNYLHNSAEARMGLYQAGPNNGTIWAATLDRDNAFAASLMLTAEGYLITRGNGDVNSSHGIPYRTYTTRVRVDGGQGIQEETVNFPADKFTDIPTVIATPINSGNYLFVANVTGISETGCTVRLGRADGGIFIGQWFVELLVMQATP